MSAILVPEQTRQPPSGSLPNINNLCANVDFVERSPSMNPEDASPFPPPSFDSTVDSIHSLTMGAQFEGKQCTPSTSKGKAGLHQSIYPKVPEIVRSCDFRTPACIAQLPPVVPNEYIATEQVLSWQLLEQIKQLTMDSFDKYHPWKYDEEHPVHAIIDQVVREVTSKFSQDDSAQGIMDRFRLCEKAIHEFERLPNLASAGGDAAALLELGIRDRLVKRIEVFEATRLKREYKSTKVIPEHFLKNASFFLRQFVMRGGHYRASEAVLNAEGLFLPIYHSFCEDLEEKFNQQNIFTLPLSEQFPRTQALIANQLLPYASNPDMFNHLQCAVHLSMVQIFTNQYTPLFKRAYENGEPLPFDLHKILDGLHDLAFDNQKFFLDRDPRKTFIETVFGGDDIIELRQRAAKAAIEGASTLLSEPLQPRNFWQRLINPFGKPLVPKPSVIAQVSEKEKLQNLAIDDLEKYMTRVIVEPINLTFPKLPGNEKPVLSYVDIAFPDVLESTASNEDLLKQFPIRIQRDILRHLRYSRIIGPIENCVEATFKKNVGKKNVPHVNILYKEKLYALEEELKIAKQTPEQQQAEELLRLYYKGKQNEATFIDKLSAFPPSNVFLYLFWRIAVKANVKIAEGENDWAREHYKDKHFVHLTMHALEWYLGA